jgi:hypothetical protein
VDGGDVRLGDFHNLGAPELWRRFGNWVSWLLRRARYFAVGAFGGELDEYVLLPSAGLGHAMNRLQADHRVIVQWTGCCGSSYHPRCWAEIEALARRHGWNPMGSDDGRLGPRDTARLADALERALPTVASYGTCQTIADVIGRCRHFGTVQITRE